MHAPKEILNVWKQFDTFPMERFTKFWYANQNPINYQRTIEQIKAHYETYKITGNCFDLAIWLLHEFKGNGIKAYATGHDLMTEDAHVGVIALDKNGYRYLCDLGDQWIQPICIDPQHPDFHSNDCEGFFPGATVQVHPLGDEVEIHYKRPNGKVPKQRFSIQPISYDELIQAGEFSQSLPVKGLLLEVRQFNEEEVTHWEFDNFESFTSTMSGKFYDEPLDTVEQWAQRIHQKTNYPIEIVEPALTYFKARL